MIEINLMPSGRGGSAGGPEPGRRRYLRLAVGACVPGAVAIVVFGVLYAGAVGRGRELEVALAQAAHDSVEFAQVIAARERLQATRDSVGIRMAVIEELDHGRYTWSRILDQVAAALPPYTWLTRMGQVDGAETLILEIEGRTASTRALTGFMNRLEASPFLQRVELVATEQVVEHLPGGSERGLIAFVLELGYRSLSEPSGKGEVGADPASEDAGRGEGEGGGT